MSCGAVPPSGAAPSTTGPRGGRRAHAERVLAFGDVGTEKILTQTPKTPFNNFQNAKNSLKHGRNTKTIEKH